MLTLSPTRFTVSLLGRFELSGPDGLVELPNKKLAGLLAFLACSAPEPQLRERLAALLWGSHFDDQARHSLRQGLFRLRQVLGQEVLVGNGDEVCLAPGVLTTDVQRFHGLISTGSLDALKEAVGLYRDRFLVDVTVTENAWIEWVTNERQRLEDLALDTMVRLGNDELEANHCEQALTSAQRALSINNLREDAHRLVIRTLAAAGRRADALKHYDDVVALLMRELNVEPDAATKALATQLRRSYSAPNASAPVPRAPAARVLELPDRPSIAVLSFTNLSGDSSQEYLSDGITEDIITELSRFSELFVIARNSSFQYKGKSIDVRQIGRELGVRYILEGSIRRDGDRVRIAAQLIDAATGAHRWAERYDRKLEDVFAVQDEVARTIVALLAAHVNKAEVERSLLKPPEIWQAYDYYLRAAHIYASYWSSFKVEDLYETRRLLDQSLTIDPNYARACAVLSCTHLTAFLNPLDGDFANPAARERAYDLACKAVQLDPNLPLAHAYLGDVLVCKRQYEVSIAEHERAITLNANFSHLHCAMALAFAGEPTRAIEVVERHKRLDPFYTPQAPFFLGIARYFLKQYLQALSPLRESVLRAPNFIGGHLYLAATYAQLGLLADAGREAALALQINPKYTIDGTARPFSMLKYSKDRELFFDGMRKAGVPEN